MNQIVKNATEIIAGAQSWKPELDSLSMARILLSLHQEKDIKRPEDTCLQNNPHDDIPDTSTRNKLWLMLEEIAENAIDTYIRLNHNDDDEMVLSSHIYTLQTNLVQDRYNIILSALNGHQDYIFKDQIGGGNVQLDLFTALYYLGGFYAHCFEKYTKSITIREIET